mmetsp:Transcript_9283/g.19467  ORF Transcript_9283/g.19467 Transcript_9283/m.19467 type:complete len:333 (+) Transcript_9283:199-1197(+)
MKHGSVSSKSNSSKNEECKGELLSSRSLGTSANGGAGSVHNNFSGFVITSCLERFNEITDNALLRELVFIAVVVGVSAIESIRLFALGRSFVQLFAHLENLDFLFFSVIVLVVVVILFLGLQARNAVGGVDSLQECMGKLHANTISIHKVIIDILVRIGDVAILVVKDSNLDLGSATGTHWPGVKGGLAIIFRIVDHLALKEFSCVNISIVFHVLDLHTFVVTGVAVDTFEAATATFIVFVLFIFFFVLLPVVAFLASIAHLLLHLLLVFNGCLQIFLEVDDVFSKVVATRVASIGWAQSEDNKSLGGKDCFRIFPCEFVVVSLHELTLFEL